MTRRPGPIRSADSTGGTQVSFRPIAATVRRKFPLNPVRDRLSPGSALPAGGNWGCAVVGVAELDLHTGFRGVRAGPTLQGAAFIVEIGFGQEIIARPGAEIAQRESARCVGGGLDIATGLGRPIGESNSGTGDRATTRVDDAAGDSGLGVAVRLDFGEVGGDLASRSSDSRRGRLTSHAGHRPSPRR